jgi:murein DD-endopeptidase MepM/ murein hydrolase activator NlpD
VVKPAEGTFTSGYGARWGGTHYGIDIANSIGTPIVAAMPTAR